MHHHSGLKRSYKGKNLSNIFYFLSYKQKSTGPTPPGQLPQNLACIIIYIQNDQIRKIIVLHVSLLFFELVKSGSDWLELLSITFNAMGTIG